MATLLTRSELTRALEELSRWSLHRGAIRTHIEAPDFPAAAALVGRIAEVAEEMDHHPDIDIRWRNLDVALATHSAGGITALDVEQAHRIEELAEQAGADLNRPPEPADGLEIAIDCMDPSAIREFWKVGLGLEEKTMPDGSIELAGSTENSPGVWFQQMTEPRPDRNRIHFDVYVPHEQALGRVAAVMAAGGWLVSDAHAPGWWVLADAEGNELCVCV